MNQTALHWAAKRAHAKIAEHLLKLGADPNALDIMCRTPLFFASKEGHLEVVKLLLLHGADPFQTTKKGISARHVTSSSLINLLLKKAEQA